jgi:hypothetical protein
MALIADPPFPKTQGDNIRSKDWNDAVNEIIRLDNAKVDRAGDRITGSLTVDGKVGVGTATPGSPLHVADHLTVGPFASGSGSIPGRLEVSGTAAELSFIRRDLTAFPASPAAGDRYVWYNQGGVARLYTEVNGDLVYVTGAGRVGIGVSNPSESLEVSSRIKAGALTVGPWPPNSAYVFFGTHALDQTQPGNYALLQGTTGGDVGTTYLNSPKTIHLRIGNADKLVVNQDGKITSPMWNVTQVMNARQGALPVSGGFMTGGGTLLIIASGSGWSPGGGSNIGMVIQLDGGTIGTARSFSNEAGSHKAFTTNPLVQRNVAAGSHTITLSIIANTATDFNDWFNVTVLELPF